MASIYPKSCFECPRQRIYSAVSSQWIHSREWYGGTIHIDLAGYSAGVSGCFVTKVITFDFSALVLGLFDRA